MELEYLQYPVGRWQYTELTNYETHSLLLQMISLAAGYKKITSSLTDAQLSKQYRPGSWNIRQLVHHVADTHLWHYARLKHALVFDAQPGYATDINVLASLPDYTEPIAASLELIIAIHNKYKELYSKLSPEQLSRSYYHKMRDLNIPLPQALDMTVWHLKHHLAHINIALNS
jgi:hypothetical protein